MRNGVTMASEEPKTFGECWAHDIRKYGRPPKNYDGGGYCLSSYQQGMASEWPKVGQRFSGNSNYYVCWMGDYTFAVAPYSELNN